MVTSGTVCRCTVVTVAVNTLAHFECFDLFDVDRAIGEVQQHGWELVDPEPVAGTNITVTAVADVETDEATVFVGLDVG